MFGDIIHHITITEIVVAVIMYLIVRSIIWCLRQTEQGIERLFKSETHKLIHNHVHNRHKGSYENCKDCVLIMSIDSMV